MEPTVHVTIMQTKLCVTKKKLFLGSTEKWTAYYTVVTKGQGATLEGTVIGSNLLDTVGNSV